MREFMTLMPFFDGREGGTQIVNYESGIKREARRRSDFLLTFMVLFRVLIPIRGVAQFGSAHGSGP